jgi:hypothetical protein
VRHELFDAEFQQELATILKDTTVGKTLTSPAKLEFLPTARIMYFHPSSFSAPTF